MPSITDDWQARLVERDIVIGRGTPYPGLGGIRGTGVLRPRTGDQARGHGDGDARAVDTLPQRLLTMPVEVLGDTPAAVWANYRTLAVAWRRSRTTDLSLDVRIPGSAEQTLRFFGRPMELVGDPHGLKGHLATVAEFRADPYAYGAAVVSAVDSSSPLTLLAANMGDTGCDTTRATITVVGSGGTPSIENTTYGGAIDWAVPLANAVTAVIDLHAQTMTIGGIDFTANLRATSDWFALAGGVNNTLTFTGCTSIQVTHRPAYVVL